MKNFNLDFTKIQLLPKKLKVGKGGEALIDSAAMSIMTFAEELNKIFGIKMSKDFEEKIKTPKLPDKQEPKDTPPEEHIKTGRLTFEANLTEFFAGVSEQVQRSFYWWLGKMYKVVGSNRIFLEQVNVTNSLAANLESPELAAALEDELKLLPAEDQKNISSVLKNAEKAKQFEEAITPLLMKALRANPNYEKKKPAMTPEKLKEVTTNLQAIKRALNAEGAKFQQLKTLSAMGDKFTPQVYNAIVRFFIIMHASVPKQAVNEQEEKMISTSGVVTILNKYYKNLDWSNPDDPQKTLGFVDKYPTSQLILVLNKMLMVDELKQDYAIASKILVRNKAISTKLFLALAKAVKAIDIKFPISYARVLAGDAGNFMQEDEESQQQEPAVEPATEPATEPAADPGEKQAPDSGEETYGGAMDQFMEEDEGIVSRFNIRPTMKKTREAVKRLIAVLKKKRIISEVIRAMKESQLIDESTDDQWVKDISDKITMDDLSGFLDSEEIRLLKKWLAKPDNLKMIKNLQSPDSGSQPEPEEEDEETEMIEKSFGEQIKEFKEGGSRDLDGENKDENWPAFAELLKKNLDKTCVRHNRDDDMKLVTICLNSSPGHSKKKKNPIEYEKASEEEGGGHYIRFYFAVQSATNTNRYNDAFESINSDNPVDWDQLEFKKEK